MGGCWIYIATVTIQYKATRLWLITILKYMILMDPFLMLAFLMSHFLIPARNRSGRRITDAEAGPKVCEQLHRKTVGHDIRELVSRRNVEDANLPQGHLLANEVDVDLDMLGATVVDRVSSHVDGANIVAVDHCSQGYRDVKFLKKLPHPAAFGDDMCNSPVFGLSPGAGDHGMPFG